VEQVASSEALGVAAWVGAGMVGLQVEVVVQVEVVALLGVEVVVRVAMRMELLMVEMLVEVWAGLQVL